MNCVIDIKSLALGTHSQDFKIGREFFVSFGGGDVVDADLCVKVDVTKASGWIKVDCNITGEVTVECDRCLAELRLPVDISAPFTVKFSSVSIQDDDDVEYGDDVIVLGPSEGELDMSQTIYDYVMTSIPLKKVHDEGECDPVMLEKMKEILR
ncbi:MAG: DUF177 domain-containing protein [Bacteroidales bacterium]|nr:DUF177 domain-containing protein [Bacteroidales bacterium]